MTVISSFLAAFPWMVLTLLFTILFRLFLVSVLGIGFDPPAFFLAMFLFVPTFFVVHRLLKLILDESARYKMGTDLGFTEAELIFSRYPLKVGENDRVTFRRRLKNNYWTKLFKINNFSVNSHITVNLVCVERTTNINTMIKDDVAVIYEKMIYSDNLFCGDREVITHFDLEIPLSCSSSFEGENNKIRWILDMEESYPGLLEQKHTYLTFVVDS